MLVGSNLCRGYYVKPRMLMYINIDYVRHIYMGLLVPTGYVAGVPVDPGGGSFFNSYPTSLYHVASDVAISVYIWQAP